MGPFSFFRKEKKQKRGEAPRRTEQLTMRQEQSEEVGSGLQENLEKFQQIFSYPLNEDFIVRRLYVRSLRREAALVFLESMVNEDTIERFILTPLGEMDVTFPEGVSCGEAIRNLVHIQNLSEAHHFKDPVEMICQGFAVLVVDGFEEVVMMSTAKTPSRAIEKPQNEGVLKGPHEGFTESGKVNRSLIRKQVRDENLITETIRLGERAISDVTVMYVKNIANDELVQQVKDRVKQIKVDKLQGLATLEQHLEERPYSLVPTILYTERPDRAAVYLMEGHVVLLMESSPAALVAPVTFWAFFQTAEDSYQRWAYGNFLRVIRLISFFIAMLTPSIYIAATNYHTEMIPTDLTLAIAATREIVPFPAVVEVLIMEVSFEILREAGVRVPSPIGPTIGIVGALILGQAAVEANIISPILVIVVAITGLSSFAIPDMSFSLMIRMTRFVFLIAASFIGLYGITATLAMAIAYLVSIKSFGVPFLAPLAPHYRSSKDMIFRPPVWKKWLRPFYMQTEDQVRMKKPKGGSRP
ncbi:MAG TPA: spore germination protein [Bacilli bacterium]|nr:spore germination protein [Bacilli bacterium]